MVVVVAVATQWYVHSVAMIGKKLLSHGCET